MKAATNLRWRRAEKETGLRTIGYRNDLRPWYLTGVVDGVSDTVCTISNDACNHRAGMAEQHKDEWVASFIIREPEFQRFTLKARFTTEELPKAKAAVRLAYLTRVSTKQPGESR